MYCITVYIFYGMYCITVYIFYGMYCITVYIFYGIYCIIACMSYGIYCINVCILWNIMHKRMYIPYDILHNLVYVSWDILHNLVYIPWVGDGGFLRWWPPSTMWASPLILYGHHPGCLNNPIFSNMGLCAACWTHFMCHNELWPTSLSHPFSFLNSCLGGLAGGKHYQKITIPIFWLVLQNFAIPGCFPYILFCRYLLSLLSPGWFVIAVCDSISGS